MERELRKLVDLYESIREGNKEEVISLYENFQKSLPYPLTPRKDSILHVAIYMRQENLAREILTKYSNLLTARNIHQDTILHEVAATNMTSLMKSLLKKAPDGLLLEINTHGETPLFRAAHYGQTEMFWLLVDELEGKFPAVDHHLEYLQREADKTTILHMTVLNENFDLALEIAKKYEKLVSIEDENGMRPLQLLSSIPSAFKSGNNYGVFKKFIYNCVPSDEDTKNEEESNREDTHESDQGHKLPPNYDVCVQFFSMVVRFLISVWPTMERICEEKRKHESAFKLASFLIQKNESWTESSDREDPGKISLWPPTPQEYGGDGSRPGEESKTSGTKETVTSEPIEGTSSSTSSPTGGGNEGGTGKGNDQGTTPGKETPPPLTPLFLATSTGIVEIVKKILEVYPQAVEHVSHEGKNILHVAIQHRQLEIFHIVKKMDIPMNMLIRRFDKDGHTILHHVGHKQGYNGGSTQPGPAFQLQEELRWLERVRKVTPHHYQMHRSKENGETADEFFKRNHGELLKEAQDWLMRTTESCSTVSVLIATVAFAAAYTVPGGSNQETGVPILLHDPFFLFFTVMDVLSLASSLTSVVMFLSILTSPFELKDFRHSLPRKLTLGFTFLFFSVAVTMLTFASTIVLVIHLKKRWTTTLLYTAAFLPVTVFALLQFPLYLAFMSTLKFSLRLIRNLLPRCFLPRRFHKATCKTI